MEPKNYSIKKIDYSGQQLSRLPSDITYYQDLIYIDLSSNNLTEFPPDLFELKKLKVINLRGNPITTISGKEILRNLPNLNYLDILETNIRNVPISLKKVLRDLPYCAKWCND